MKFKLQLKILSEKHVNTMSVSLTHCYFNFYRHFISKEFVFEHKIVSVYTNILLDMVQLNENLLTTCLFLITSRY